MEHCFVRLMSFSNQKSIKQFSRYELKKKATVLSYTFEKDRFAPDHYKSPMHKSPTSKKIEASAPIENHTTERHPFIYMF